ncbi:MAG: mechanosensitive ion channel [Alphaproteobacteria bacterium]|nr:mechanosensitive ion channel [Alphaproteobacteria bacterium]
MTQEKAPLLNQSIPDLANQAVQFLYNRFWNENMAMEGLVLAFAILLSFLLAQGTALAVRRHWNFDRKRSWIRKHFGIKQFFFQLYTVLFSWIAVLVFIHLMLPHNVMETVAILVSAWTAIRIISTFIRSPSWSFAVAIAVWVIAALHIIGWLDPVMEIMDQAKFEVGRVTLSMLGLVKGFIAFSCLYWSVTFVIEKMDFRINRSTSLTPTQKIIYQKISRFILYVTILIVVLKTIGIDLTTFAFVGGALGVGIGFGLQKVVSNLVCGIILLMDKSVKPGDIISIGDRFGWVDNIGARYVSIVTQDGKEHLVPNELLITEKVENWSYSDNNVRVIIPVSASYEADVHLVLRLLAQSFENMPRILKAPEPSIVVLNLGDNAIMYEIRVWISDPIEGISNLKSDIYIRILELFKEHGVAIPYPQRDVHVTLPEGLEQLLADYKKNG